MLFLVCHFAPHCIELFYPISFSLIDIICANAPVRKGETSLCLCFRQLGSKLMHVSRGHTPSCQCGLCPALARLLRVVATGSQVPGFVPYATLRAGNLLGELQDYIEVNPPAAREGPARPPPPRTAGPGPRVAEDPTGTARPSDSRENSTRAGHRAEASTRAVENQENERKEEGAREKSPERDRDPEGRRDSVEIVDRPPAVQRSSRHHRHSVTIHQRSEKLV